MYSIKLVGYVSIAGLVNRKSQVSLLKRWTSLRVNSPGRARADRAGREEAQGAKKRKVRRPLFPALCGLRLCVRPSWPRALIERFFGPHKCQNSTQRQQATALHSVSRIFMHGGEPTTRGIFAANRGSCDLADLYVVHGRLKPVPSLAARLSEPALPPRSMPSMVRRTVRSSC